MTKKIITFFLMSIFNTLALYCNNSCLDNFFRNDILQISGLILSISIPSVIFLIGTLIPLPGDFSEEIKEVKWHVYLLFYTFIAILILSILNPFVFLPDLGLEGITPKSILQVVVLNIFFLQIYALFRIADLVFGFALAINEAKGLSNDNLHNDDSESFFRKFMRFFKL